MGKLTRTIKDLIKVNDTSTVNKIIQAVLEKVIKKKSQGTVVLLVD